MDGSCFNYCTARQKFVSGFVSVDIEKRDEVVLYFSKSKGKKRGRGSSVTKNGGDVDAKYKSMVSSFGNTEKEIERWIEQRRKNFPTLSKVSKVSKVEPVVHMKGDSNPAPKPVKKIHGPKLCINFLNRVCKYGDSCKYSHDEKEKYLVLEKRRQNLRPNLPTTEKPDLYTKLVADERTKEVQAVRQIIRFFCDNAFFTTTQ